MLCSIFTVLAAERLSDATQVLKDIHSVFKDGESSDRSKESALLCADIEKNLLIPLLKHASDTVRVSALLEVVYNNIMSKTGGGASPLTLPNVSRVPV